jgi:hypothetical protein
MLSKPWRAPAILIAVLTLPLFGADKALWSNLGSLKPGDRIGIVRSDQTHIEGRFESFTASAIAVRTDQVVTVANNDVVRVYRRPRISRPWRALIGGAIGVAAGVLLDQTVGTFFRNEGHDVASGAWIAGGAGIGAGIGALTGGGSSTVYQR